jgi:hypothetical protein
MSLMDAQIKDTLAQRDYYKNKCNELTFKLSMVESPNQEVASQSMQDQLRSKDEIISSLKESLRSLSLFNRSITMTKHYTKPE